MDGETGELRWADAALAAALIAVDPRGLPGAWIRTGDGAGAERWLAQFQALLPTAERLRRVPVHVAEDRLLGGLDLAATLAAGRPIAQRGLLAEADRGFLLLPMIARFEPAIVAQLTAALDASEVVVERNALALREPARFGVIALDDEPGEPAHGLLPLVDRLPFLLDFDGVRPPREYLAPFDRAAVAAARARLAGVRVPDAMLEALCAAALALGIGSLRPSLHAVRAATALAALDGRDEVDEADAARAARLVLAPRALVLPEPPSEDAPPSEPPPERAPADAAEAQPARSETPPPDVVLAAALAAIPRGLLERLRRGQAPRERAATRGRAGALRQSLLRGRPAGTRRGAPRPGVRLSLVDTLRAAAPWQRLRRQGLTARAPRRIEIRRDDFHVTRHQQRSQTTTVFVVDASGSSAHHRLAEAKGAVELLLADCYVRRDQVAVIAFRGKTAELVLPPTRSLLRAKRSLAALPGGQGTPLAAGIDAGAALALQLRRLGQTVTVVLLTDGQANVARDGTPGRERAQADAVAAARRLRESGALRLFIDISPRPQPLAQRLAAEMDAHYLPLPYADARKLSDAVQRAGSRARAVTR